MIELTQIIRLHMKLERLGILFHIIGALHGSGTIPLIEKGPYLDECLIVAFYRTDPSAL